MPQQIPQDQFDAIADEIARQYFARQDAKRRGFVSRGNVHPEIERLLRPYTPKEAERA